MRFLMAMKVGYELSLTDRSVRLFHSAAMPFSILLGTTGPSALKIACRLAGALKTTLVLERADGESSQPTPALATIHSYGARRQRQWEMIWLLLTSFL